MSRADTALVTGASRGIGRALALALARRGHDLALVARTESALAETAAEVRALGRRAETFVADVRDPKAVRAAVEAADQALGGLDVVVANAGVATARWSGKLTYDDCADTIDVNVRGAVATLLAALPGMLARGRGTLVGISSVVAYRGMPKLAAYSGSKAFLSAFLDVLRVDLRKTPVRVVDVRPGYVATDMLGTSRPPGTVEPDAAARRIADGIARARPVVTFPWHLAALLRLLRCLPPALYDRLVG